MNIKTLISFSLLVVITGMVRISAQNTAISDDDAYVADPSAMLDVKSTTKGLLVPRMSSANRLAIGTPATSLLVFDTDQQAYYYYNGTAWVDLSVDNLGNHIATSNIQLNSHWLSGDGGNEGIYIDNNGNVGIGTSAPGKKLHIQSSSFEVLRLERTGAGGAAVELVNANNDIGSFCISSGGAIFFKTPSITDGTAFSILNSGDVGIGTLTPATKLDVIGNVQINNWLFEASGSDRFIITSNNSVDALLTVKTLDNSKRTDINFADPEDYNVGRIQYQHSSDNSTDYMSFWVSDGEKVRIKNNGDVGIGTTTPSTKLNVVAARPNGYVAEFENLSSSGSNGINIKVATTSISNDNVFIGFKNGSGTSVGRIRGFNAASDWVSLPTWTTLDDMLCYMVDRGYLTFNAADWLLLLAAEPLLAICNDGGVEYTSINGDYAEYLEKLDPEEEFMFGQVVGVYGGKITKKTNGAEQFMVLSRAPVVLGNLPTDDKEEFYEKVAFMGQVPVWVKGNVNSGDYIIPSGEENGLAIAVSPENITPEQSGMVIGRSWSEGNNNMLNLVNIVIGVRSDDLSNFIVKQAQEINELKERLRRVEAMEARIGMLEEKLQEKDQAVY
ncbi:MAG: hypothetical protein ABIJ16_07625 [Bacteroidota bacterium]